MPAGTWGGQVASHGECGGSVFVNPSQEKAQWKGRVENLGPAGENEVAPPSPCTPGAPKAKLFSGELPYLGFRSEEGVAHVADSLVGVLLVAHAVDVDVCVILKRDAGCS